MMRIAIGVLLVAALSTSVIVQSSERVADGKSAQSENRAGWFGDVPAVGENADAHRFALHVNYFSYSRHEEWQWLKAAGLSDSEAVRFLLTTPTGTDLASQMLP